MKSTSLVFLLLVSTWHCFAQDEAYARALLNTLAGEEFHGRGYVNRGDSLAAEFIAGEFQKNGLLPVDSSYFQRYTMPVNTFPGKVLVRLDGKKLQPGTDYVISSSSPSLHGKYSLIYLDDSIHDEGHLNDFLNDHKVSDAFLVTANPFKEIYGKTLPGVKGIVLLTAQTPYWHVSNADTLESTCWIKARMDLFSTKPTKLTINLTNRYYNDYPSRNVVGVVPGKGEPGRYIAITAHYDHLGMMGKHALYPGANDNASGTAMMLDLARHYAKQENRPERSMVFMAFSGEEAGLKGSEYYVEHPLFRLDRIDLLINLDMVGTGSEGITVVNAAAYKSLYDKLLDLNETGGYLPDIKERGEACNSDHCPFYKKGVKSIFIYTMGKEHTAYHTPEDSPGNIPFTAYNGLFRLIVDYLSTLEE
jgi:aminopeptidase YwaD